MRIITALSQELPLQVHDDVGEQSRDRLDLDHDRVEADIVF